MGQGHGTDRDGAELLIDLLCRLLLLLRCWSGYKDWGEVSGGEALPPFFSDIPGAADPNNSGEGERRPPMRGGGKENGTRASRERGMCPSALWLVRWSEVGLCMVDCNAPEQMVRDVGPIAFPAILPAEQQKVRGQAGRRAVLV